MTLGPVQVLTVGFAGAELSRDVLAELARVEDSGIVRLIDVLLVACDEEGQLDTVEPATASLPPGSGAIAAALLGVSDRATADWASDDATDSWSIADALAPGSSAAVLLIEHRWASPLLAAIGRAGGQPLDETWLGTADRELLESLLDR